ncbi:ribonuclease H-like domain-containing protein [Lachnospiraceae bacterium 45-W7]
MKILNRQTNFPPGLSLVEELFPDSSLFFDIETTGFSAANTHVYLIGCAARTEHTIQLTQFFAETPAEEEQILSAFLALTAQYNQLISFNGRTFDVPYLKERCAVHHLAHSFDTLTHLDIYRKLSKFKPLLNLPGLKQKSLEKFINVEREDTYSGGDLIELYLQYVKNPSEHECSLLLLHNYEDILGMIKILPVLAYPQLFEGGFHIIAHEENIYQTYEHQQAKELILTLSLKYPLPKRISLNNENIYFTGSEYRAKLKIPVFYGELKHFYPNYREYYYLPQEDCAIHKSVAFYVDKEYRAKAKASTCYIRKTGDFLPQFQENMTPWFKQEYRDKITWFEMTEDFLASSELQKNYALHILEWLLKVC